MLDIVSMFIHKGKSLGELATIEVIAKTPSTPQGDIEYYVSSKLEGLVRPGNDTPYTETHKSTSVYNDRAAIQRVYADTIVSAMARLL